MSRQLPYEISAHILSYLSLVQLGRYKLKSNVVYNILYTKYLLTNANVNEIMETHSIDVDDVLILFGTMYGDLAFGSQVYFTYSRCLSRAIQLQNVELVEYFTNMMSEGNFANMHLQLACGYPNIEIIKLIFTKLTVEVGLKLNSYELANIIINDYYNLMLKSHIGVNNIPQGDSYYLYTFNPDPFEALVSIGGIGGMLPDLDFSSDLMARFFEYNQCITKKLIENCARMKQLLTEWPNFAGKDEYLALCDLLLGKPFDYMLFVDNYVAQIALSILSPQLSEMLSYLYQIKLDNILPSEVLYDTNLLQNNEYLDFNYTMSIWLSGRPVDEQIDRFNIKLSGGEIIINDVDTWKWYQRYITYFRARSVIFAGIPSTSDGAFPQSRPTEFLSLVVQCIPVFSV